MGTVQFSVSTSNFLSFYEISFAEYLKYSSNLGQLKQAYLACTSLLFVFEIASFLLNLFNYGESVNTQNEMETLTKVLHGIYIAIMVLQVLFHLGLIAIFIPLNIYGLIYYREPAFVASMVYSYF